MGAKIASFIESYRKPGQPILDVCCGALNVTRYFKPPRFAIDVCKPLITTLKAGLAGWEPPISVSRERYDWQRLYGTDDDPLTGFLMFGRSYGGKAWGGYIGDFYYNHRERYLQRNGECARNTFLRKMRACKDAELFLVDCLSLAPSFTRGLIIYADPPYYGTTAYNGTEAFDSVLFWRMAEAWHDSGALVFVSEETTFSPRFRAIKEWPTNNGMARQLGKARVEKLFAAREYFG